MCGIFLFVKSYYKHIPVDLLEITSLYNRLSKRGPDHHNLTLFGNDIMGFHRLSINDLSVNGIQPFTDLNNYLMCNGEIYNHLEIESKYNIKNLKSTSDCEFLLPLLIKNISRSVISQLDGVFAIVAKIGCRYYFIRDRIGVKPLFIFKCDNFIAAASDPISLEFQTSGEIIEVNPGTILSCDFSFNFKEDVYSSIPKRLISSCPLEDVISTTRDLLISAVEKRLMSDRPIGCLLSGGLDSSIISSIVADIYRKQGKTLKTFSVGFRDSTDLKYARKVSKHIGSTHHELIITPDEGLTLIPSIVKNIGTWDITTIRASTPMWYLCQWISSTFEEKVLFSGEGSDEVFGGYLYFHSAPNPEEFEYECNRLVTNLYKYDVLRADRCMSGNSLELREPFLDKNLLDYYLTLPPALRMPKNGYEKWILREAFDHMLPKDVCWRRKTAFSDGIASAEKPWFKYIQEWTDTIIDLQQMKNDGFKTTESYWYYILFKKYYKTYNPKINYWLPKWQEDYCTDPSATTLKIWNKHEH